MKVEIGRNVKGFCDWCAKPSTRPLVPVALKTPRGTFQQDICEECAESASE
jgi:hypothetical protein